LETDGNVVQAAFVPRAEHVGFQGVVHGGLVTTVLDEVMAWACAVLAGRFAYCAELIVRFAQPVRPGQATLAVAQIANNRRNKLFEARAELRATDGTILASATGKYIPLKAAELQAIHSDLVGDTKEFLGRAI
jgi:acyl-coenzyme A thioesterase PaaI-like protein